MASTASPQRPGAPGPAASAGSAVDIGDLLDLARDKSVEGRTALVKALGDLFYDSHAELSGDERRLMGDILQRLIGDVESAVRKALAETLKSIPEVPQDIISALANDAIDIAYPILIESAVLQDIDLIEIIRHRTHEHQLAIAMRETVSEAVSEALVETDDNEVIRTLIENRGARISGEILERIVDRSETQTELQDPLLRRQELSPPLAKKMYWWVSAALRKSIVDRFDIDSVELDKSIERAVKDLMGEPVAKAANAGNIDGMIKSLIGAGKVTTTLMIQTLRQGEIALFEEMLAGLADLNTKLVRRFVFEPGGEALAILCRSLEIMKPDFASIFLLIRSARPGDKVVDPSELTRVLDLYDRIKTETAKKVLEHWRLDPDYLFALKQLNGRQRQAAAE
ncbi:MAG: DUF2336 domain-containing protein [Rhodospirillaceae bacterium]